MENFEFYYWGVFFAIIGLLIGSFLNVCILRMPKNETIVTVPSHCMSCSHKLAWYDLIPVFSYVFLGGKCRYCKAKISPRYAFVEALTCAVWTFVYFYYGSGLSVEIFLVALFFSALIVITFTDIDVQIVPDKIHIFIFLLGIAYLYLDFNNWLSHVIGFFAVSVPVLVLAMLTDGFGGGDIKLYAVLGFFMGWQKVVLCFAFSTVFGGIFSVIFLALKLANRKSRISFVPYMAAAAFITQLFGDNIINWYISNFFPS